jgi:flavin-dependent dehydrogenase
MKAPRPIEVVGGGLSGLSLGLGLRRAGVPVTLFESGDYPRHRVCGEFISGLDDETARATGILDFTGGALLHRAVTYHLRGRPLRPFRLPEAALGISRHALDARLARAFVAEGGRLHTGTRADLDPAEGRVIAAGRRRGGRFWVGLKVHVRKLELAGDLEVHLGERCYVGLSRVETGDVNVCGVFGRQRSEARGAGLLHAYLEGAGLARLSERLRGAGAREESFCTMAVSLGDPAVRDSGALRIGDACATIAPFTGNGMAMALQGAALALGPLRAYAAGDMGWEEARLEVARAEEARFRRRLSLARRLHPFFLGPFRQALLAAAARSGILPFRAFYSATR